MNTPSFLRVRPTVYAALSFVVLMVGEARSFAAVLLSENWSSYSAGDVPSSPWVVSGTGGTTSSTGFTAPSFVKIADLSGNKVAQLESASTNEVGSTNPTLRWNFTPTADPDLEISFSYNLAALQNTGGGTNTNPMFQTFNTGATQGGIYLGLGGSSSSGNLAFFNSSGSIVSLGKAVNQTEWITITLSDISFTNHTYDIAWSSNEGGSGSYNNASFRSITSNDLAMLRFVDNVPYTQDEGTTLYVDNILVQTIPEPTTLMFSIVGLSGLACLRRGRRNGRTCLE